MKFNYKIVFRVEICSILLYCFKDHKEKLNQLCVLLENKQATGVWWKVQQAECFCISVSSRCSELSWACLHITSLVENQQKCSCLQVRRISSGSVCESSCEREGSGGEGWAVGDRPCLLPLAHRCPFLGAWQLLPSAHSLGFSMVLLLPSYNAHWGNNLKQSRNAGADLGKRTLVPACCSGEKKKKKKDKDGTWVFLVLPLCLAWFKKVLSGSELGFSYAVLVFSKQM